MASLLLTRANLAAAKRNLRTLAPALTSSHATEVLAFGLSYRNHAAMLADLKSRPPHMPRLVKLDKQRLASRAANFGVADLNIEARQVIDAALPEPLWKAFPRPDLGCNNAWYRECQQRNIPNVFLHIGRKYWRVNWDCISLDPRHDQDILGKREDQVMEQLFAAFQVRARCDSPKAQFYGSSFVGDAEKLLPDTARALADDFFELLYSRLKAA